ncbi:MAG TPA: response regulator [Thermoanaerobaculia bacterium]|nr:response regulator [Thermoanaerobaculia bacterium]
MRSILIVEDDRLMTKLLNAMLPAADYEVVSINDGSTALLELRRRRFDAVLLDLNIPHLDGFSLIEVLRQEGIDVPIMLMTASPEPELEARAHALGVADFIPKPIQKAMLIKRLEKVFKAD